MGVADNSGAAPESFFVWTGTIRRRGSAADLVLLLLMLWAHPVATQEAISNPPWRTEVVRGGVSPGQSFEALARTPREFSFVATAKDYEAAREALDVLLRPTTHREEEIEATRRRISALPVFPGTLWIEDGSATLPDPPQENGAIEWFSFRAEFCVSTESPTPADQQSARAGAVLRAMDGWIGPAWLAKGDGFSSFVTYEWAVHGQVLTRELIRFDAAGQPIHLARGVFQVHSGDGSVRYREDDGAGGGFVARAQADEHGVWLLLGGDQGGYNRLVRLVADTVLEVQETIIPGGEAEDDLLSRTPLVYRRLGPAAVREAAAEERAYMSHPNGEWWSASSEAEGDPAAPPVFRYRSHEKGEALHVDIVIELPDGGSYTAWQILSSFDVDPGVIRTHQVGFAGALLEGRMDPLPDGTHLLRMNGNGPDGAPVVFMERKARDGPDAFRSTSWVFDRGGWTESRRSTWRRRPAGRDGGNVRDLD